MAPDYADALLYFTKLMFPDKPKDWRVRPAPDCDKDPIKWAEHYLDGADKPDVFRARVIKELLKDKDKKIKLRMGPPRFAKH